MSKPSPAQSQNRPLVSTEWLAAHLRDPDLVVVDGSWYMTAQNRDGFEEYLAAHIPGAVFFDIDEIADHSNNLPHMLPPADVFSLHMTRLGIDNESRIVVYDGAGLFSAARVWWTLRIFGLENVFVLDGGLPKWVQEGRPVEPGMTTREPTHFQPAFDAAKVADLERMKRTLVDRSAQIVDLRPADRFRGDVPEPRPGVRSGHMPGSLNVPYTKLIDQGRLVDADAIRKAFTEAHVDLDKPVITSCGSGVSAATAWLALDTIGKEPQALYDGSWTEWGSNEELPVAIGAK